MSISSRTSLRLETASVGMAGILAGSMAFGSFVSCPTFIRLLKAKPPVDNQDTKTIPVTGMDVLRSYFSFWWPIGRDYMAPLSLLTSLIQFTTYAVTKSAVWAVTGLSTAAILPYTLFAMGNNISALLQSDLLDDSSLEKHVVVFARKHHVRTLVSGIIYIAGLLVISRRRVEQ